jgi:hypothetical protein
MNAQKFQVKVYLDGAPDLEPVIPVFHGWIRDRRVPELLIDVADYRHVPDGPGLMIVGGDTDYYLELAEGRPGLRYSRKRNAKGDLEARIAEAFRRALEAAALLEAEESLSLRFGTSELLFQVFDRLEAPNEDASVDALRPALEAVLAKLAPEGYELAREGDERQPLTLRVKRKGAERPSELAARV